ncbi:MAG: hypothetical protein GF405_10805 [Candidatus Eisenbacteria bacterium]|nr:hypothetical protein [Candidatus Eisenbacteria bacterium]
MRTAIVLVAIAVLVSAAPAYCSDEIRIEVTSIGASSPAAGRGSDEPKVDARLAGFADKLTSLFAYTRYSFLGRMQSQTTFGEPSRIAIPGRFTLVVEPQRFEGDERHRIEMLVTLTRDIPRQPADDGRPPKDPEVLLRTRIRLENGGTVLLGGPEIESGVLILALSAKG